MISGGCIPQPYPLPRAKSKVNSGVAACDGVNNRACDLVQRDVVDTEPPHEVGNIADMFLVGFRRKKSLEHPFAVVHLTDVTQFCEGRNTFAHNRSLAWSILYLFNADGASRTSVDDTLVILDGDELPFIVENQPVFLDKAIDLILHTRVEMRQIKQLAQCRTVNCLVIGCKESWVDVIERWGGVLALSENGTPVNVMEENVEVMRLVGITAVVVKDVLALLSAHPIGDTNWFGARGIGGGSK